MAGDCEFKADCGIFREENRDLCDELRHMCLYRKFRVLQEEERLLKQNRPYHFHDYEDSAKLNLGIDENSGGEK